MAKPPLPFRSQRLQETHERLREQITRFGSLPPFKRNLPLHRSRRDTTLPFTNIDFEHPFFCR